MAILFIWLSAFPIFLITLYVGFSFGDEIAKLFVNIYECDALTRTGDRAGLDIGPYDPITGCSIDPPTYLLNLMNALPTIIDGLIAGLLITLGIVVIFPRLRK